MSAPLKNLSDIIAARVALPRAGTSIATSAQLAFQLDHARARDAVHKPLDTAALVQSISALHLETMVLHSAIEPGPAARAAYLRRPDLGRRLSQASADTLRIPTPSPQVLFVIADGLSALAVERYAAAVIAATLPLLQLPVGPVWVVTQARVAIGDHIGQLLGAQVVVVLIGERPGLSAADSLGAYITWHPRIGRTDAERNCVSNIRAGGLSYDEAAARIAQLIEGARRLGASGVNLKIGATLP